MEQRSQILKQMHLTKNEREREVRLPWLGSQLWVCTVGRAQGSHSWPLAPSSP